MSTTTVDTVVSPRQLAAFHDQGVLVLPGLLTTSDIHDLTDAFDALHARGSIKGCFNAEPLEKARADGDILKAYPRMMHPHRVDSVSMRFMLHPACATILETLLGEPPIAAQSMFYWKPPTARGQAFHQDNFYLKVRPGTCIAAWVAVDATDEENGCLFVAPGSHRLDIMCPEVADTTVSFTKDYVPIPEGLPQVPVPMAAGDVMFFGGNLIHGSYPNRSANRFRRSFICHYSGSSAQQLSSWYRPLYDMHGNEVFRDTTTDGGPCGTEAAGPH